MIEKLCFQNWLFENTDHIKFAGWFSDGRIMVYVGNKLYTYTISASDHQRLKNLSKRAPGRALNIIKRLDANPEVKFIAKPGEKPPEKKLKQQEFKF